MSRTIRVVGGGVVAALALLAHAPAARAVITAFWQPVASGDGSIGTPYPAAAITADAALLNLQTWDLRVTYTEGDWYQAGLRATLPAGNAFYRSTNSGITRPELVTANREFWTYVTVPQDFLKSHHTQVLSGFPPGSPTSNGTANGANTPGLLSALWGDLFVAPPGTYRIARLTFPLGVMPDVLTADQSATFSFTAQGPLGPTVAIPELPEPTSSTLAVLALCGAAARRRRSAR